MEAVFPVQNGEVKPVQASAADSVQIVNETKAAEQKDEGKAVEPASTTSNEQQAAAESTPLVSDKEEKKEEAEKEAPPTETTPLDDTSNGPTVTVEVWGCRPWLCPLMEISASVLCFFKLPYECINIVKLLDLWKNLIKYLMSVSKMFDLN